MVEPDLSTYMYMYMECVRTMLPLLPQIGLPPLLKEDMVYMMSRLSQGKSVSLPYLPSATADVLLWQVLVVAPVTLIRPAGNNSSRSKDIIIHGSADKQFRKSIA